MNRKKIDIVGDRINLLVFLLTWGDVGQESWSVDDLTKFDQTLTPRQIASDVRWLRGTFWITDGAPVVRNGRQQKTYKSAVGKWDVQRDGGGLDFIVNHVMAWHGAAEVR